MVNNNLAAVKSASDAKRAVTLDARLSREVQSVFPKKRQDVLNWHGWGYKNSGFYLENDVIRFRGDKYNLDGLSLPYMKDWVIEKFNVQLKDTALPEMPKEYPQPTINEDFLRELRASGIALSLNGEDRLIRSHGQTMADIWHLLHDNGYDRIPDCVVWPQSHADVERLITLAHKHNVVVLPFGGGTSVSGASTCPQSEQRMICALDTSQMNRMLWLNRENLTVCFEAGVAGQDLERELRKLGLTVGHEPDSYEFSTLGGWVATRASGMKKNVYGNIEDLVVRVRMVTPVGVLERECAAPRVSCGPDFNHVIMGSEGTLGVVTEVVLKVRPLPPVKNYGSLVFPDFEAGVLFMREVARRRCQPASIRLMDNEQFIFGQVLQPGKSWLGNVLNNFKKAYITMWKGMDLSKMCAVTLLFEGEAEAVKQQEALIIAIAKTFGGFSAGSENGERGYTMTFVIAYIRDFGLSQNVVAESFETSMPWDRVSAVCRNTKRRIELECRKRNINHFMISARVTQTYDAGACVYFYFAFRYYDSNVISPAETFECIEESAREEILASGGSLSHHHGVGKIRSKWYRQTTSSAGNDLYLAAKRQLDPKNILAVRNLLSDKDWEQAKSKTDVDGTATLVKAKL